MMHYKTMVKKRMRLSKENGKLVRSDIKKHLNKYRTTKKKGQKPWIGKRSGELVDDRKWLKNSIEKSKPEK